MNYKSFKEMIEKAKSVVIFSHVNPDGDTLGTMCALNLVLKNNFNLNPVMVTAGLIPEIYRFLPGTDEIKQASELDPSLKFDLAIAVDIAAKDRMADGVRIFDNAKAKINLDHHKTNTKFGDLNINNPDAACAGEVLLDILLDLDLTIDKDTATALYTTIITDTGCFRYENTKVSTLLTAAKIIEYGADPREVTKNCYESNPKPMVMLQAHCLLNANFLEEGKLAVIAISNETMKKFNAQNDHTEGIAEALRRINTTQVSAVLKESDENRTKVSMRSKTIDVSIIASAFGGGGHTFAAGCTINKPLGIAKDKLVEEIKKYL